jgi:hypothetical protein
MAISRSTAARLCTKPELELVEASFPPDVRQLTPGRLRQKVERTRRIRDKYRDLSKRQRLESRGKTDARRSRPAQGNANTERKATLFDETLGRFEKQLARSGGDRSADALDSPSAAKKPGGRAAAAEADTVSVDAAGTKKASARQAGAKKPGVTKAGANKAGANKAGAKQIATREVGRAPAAGEAQAARPGKTGAAAPKGARQRPDSAQQAQPRAAGAHNRASGQRSQRKRDSRNTGR